MNLIDWLGLARNALWILGLSIALAAWSHSTWWASSHQQRLRLALDRQAFTIPFTAGFLLFAASMCWGATSGWERVIWAVLSLWLAWELWSGARRKTRSSSDVMT